MSIEWARIDRKTELMWRMFREIPIEWIFSVKIYIKIVQFFGSLLLPICFSKNFVWGWKRY